MVNTKLLKGAIAEKGYTQAEVASKIGITPATFSYKLNNKVEFDIDEACRLCDILGIHDRVDEIFFAKLLDLKSKIN